MAVPWAHLTAHQQRDARALDGFVDKAKRLDALDAKGGGVMAVREWDCEVCGVRFEHRGHTPECSDCRAIVCDGCAAPMGKRCSTHLAWAEGDGEEASDGE